MGNSGSTKSSREDTPLSSRTKVGGRRTLIVIAIILVVCLLCGGGYAAYHFLSKEGSGPGVMPTKEQLAKQHELSQTAAAMYEKQAAKEGDSQAASATVEWLKKQADVKDAGVGSGCIWGVYKDGTEFSIITTNPFMNK